jgi:branched-chain amino acid aminotransferase
LWRGLPNDDNIRMERGRMLFFVNDRLVPAEEAYISVLDRGFIYGDGIFETLLVKNGAVFRLREHVERLAESARIIRISLPWAGEELEEMVYETVRGNGLDEAAIRVNVSRGIGSWRLTTKGADHPTLVISMYPLPDYPPDTYTRGWPVIVSREVTVMDPVIPGRAKTSNRINLILAKREAEERGAVEAILLNRKGHLTEGTSTNLFFCSGGKLCTPALDAGILWGITREIVLAIGRELGFDLVEGRFQPSDLGEADEAFLSFTTAGVVPIHDVDGRTIGSGTAGPMTSAIIERYLRLLEEETRKEAERRAASVRTNQRDTKDRG